MEAIEYYDAKTPDELDTFSVLFTPRLWAGETLATCTLDLSVESGVDADVEQMKDGAPWINTSDLQIKNASGADVTLPAKKAVLQSLKDGKHLVDYRINFQAVTSRGRKLSKVMILPVRNAGS